MKNNQLVKKIRELCKQKNAVILSHYYTNSEVQEIADFVGDSLALSQKIINIDAKIIIFAGVYFMAETTKILSPQKKVLLPDLKSACSLADSCLYEDFKKFLEQYPNHTVISYVNTSAAIKSLTDIVVTSSNAKFIVDSLPKNEKIVFAPDVNLGNYINSETGRNMIIWNGACHVHNDFSLTKILEIKSLNSDAKIIAHPECKSEILDIADIVGSTKKLLDFTINDNSNKYIVVTESGILHEMKKNSPQKIFIPAKADISEKNCDGCNDCNYMKLNTLEKIYNCLENENNEIFVEENLSKLAYNSIKKMLDLSEKMK